MNLFQELIDQTQLDSELIDTQTLETQEQQNQLFTTIVKENQDQCDSDNWEDYSSESENFDYQDNQITQNLNQTDIISNNNPNSKIKSNFPKNKIRQDLSFDPEIIKPNQNLDKIKKVKPKTINLRKYQKILKNSFNLTNQEIFSLKTNFSSLNKFIKWFREYRNLDQNQLNKYTIDFQGDQFRSIDTKKRKMKELATENDIYQWNFITEQKNKNLLGKKKIEDNFKQMDNQEKQLELSLSIDTDFFRQQLQKKLERQLTLQIKLKLENDKIKSQLKQKEDEILVKLEDQSKREKNIREKLKSKQYYNRISLKSLFKREKINNGQYAQVKYNWGL